VSLLQFFSHFGIILESLAVARARHVAISTINLAEKCFKRVNVGDGLINKVNHIGWGGFGPFESDLFGVFGVHGIREIVRRPNQLLQLVQLF